MKHYNFKEREMTPTKRIPNAGERLNSASMTYVQRNKQYGNSYKMHGKVIEALFPKGIRLDSVEDHNRYAIINTIVGKLNRYCNNFKTGGHQDSIHDIGVYSFMLEELDAEAEPYYDDLLQKAEEFGDAGNITIV